MNTRTAKAILAKAFAALTYEQRGRLRAHAKKGTPILCASRSEEYWDEKLAAG